MVTNQLFSNEDIFSLDNYGYVEKILKSSNEIISEINTDLIMMIKIIRYYGYDDIFAKLGGYKALGEPFLVAFFPLFTLSYLIKLSRIIK